jgi:hypothetical protein
MLNFGKSSGLVNQSKRFVNHNAVEVQGTDPIIMPAFAGFDQVDASVGCYCVKVDEG